MVRGRTVINAFVGAVVGIVLSFLPFSTVLGGAVAGFLEGSDGRDGAIVGALAGAITFVPIAALAFLVLAVVGFGVSVAAAPLEGVAFVLLVIAAISTLVLLYTVGLSLLGGYLGAYLAREYPETQARIHRTIGMEGRAAAPVGDRRRPNAEPRARRARRERQRTSDARAHRDHDADDDRRDPRDEPDTFGPDPHDRLDPVRWHDERESESDSDHESERNRERDDVFERDRDPGLDRDRDRDRERDPE